MIHNILGVELGRERRGAEARILLASPRKRVHGEKGRMENDVSSLEVRVEGI